MQVERYELIDVGSPAPSLAEEMKGDGYIEPDCEHNDLRTRALVYIWGCDQAERREFADKLINQLSGSDVLGDMAWSIKLKIVDVPVEARRESWAAVRIETHHLTVVNEFREAIRCLYPGGGLMVMRQNQSTIRIMAHQP